MKTGGYAFPQGDPINGRGMTLRDYFAAAFLETMRVDVPATAEEIAKVCYTMADAMIAEREK